MRRAGRAALLAALLFGAAGCGDEPSANAGITTHRFTDPAGDGVTVEGVPPVDLVGLEVVQADDGITLVLDFAGVVTPWSRGLANSLDGYVDLDLDRDPATGRRGPPGDYPVSSAVGAEYSVLLRDRWPGQVALLRWGDDAELRVAAVFDGSRVTVRIPASRVVGLGSGMLVAAAVGHPLRSVTDVAPDGGSYSVP